MAKTARTEFLDPLELQVRKGRPVPPAAWVHQGRSGHKGILAARVCRVIRDLRALRELTVLPELTDNQEKTERRESQE